MYYVKCMMCQIKIRSSSSYYSHVCLHLQTTMHDLEGLKDTEEKKGYHANSNTYFV